MRMRKIAMCLLVVMLVSSLAWAGYFARESFEYTNGASLDTLIGVTGNGFTGIWDMDNGTLGLGFIADTALHYDDLAYPVTNIGKHAIVAVPGNWTAARYTRSLDTTWPDVSGTSYWISFLFEPNTTPTGNTYYILKLFKDASELCAIGKGGGGTTYTCGSGWPGGSGADVSTVECEAGPVWLVVKIVMSGDSGAERTYMWIDPDPSAEPDTNNADVKRSSTMNDGFNTVKIECGGELANNINFDEIRISDSWESVSCDYYYASESFEYTVGTSLDTLIGVTGNGFTGIWDMDNGTLGLGFIADTALHYDDLAYPITNTGNHAIVAVPGNWTAARYTRSLDKTWPDVAGTSYWVGFLFEPNTTPTGNTYYILKLFKDASELCAIGKGGGGTTYTCGSGWPGGSGADVSTVECEAGPVWLVTRFIMSGDAGAERTYMWIDPDPSTEPDTNNADVKRSSTMNDGFNTVKIECGGELANNINFDEIRIGPSYAYISTLTSKVKEPGNNRPVDFALSQNYPNPFNPTTNIAFTLKQDVKVRLSVIDLLGREVAVLVNGMQNAGQHNITFSGANMAAGIYLYRLQVADKVMTKKMVLVK